MTGLVAFALFQKTLSVPPSVMRMDALLKVVSAQTGITHKASDALVGRMELVIGNGLTAEELRKELAQANWAKWRNVGNELQLSEDPLLIAEREKKRLAARTSQVKKQLDQLKSETYSPLTATDITSLKEKLEKFQEADRRDPNKSFGLRREVERAAFANRATRQIVASMNPSEFAALELGKAVYSNLPTRLQRALPSSSSSIIRQLEKDQNVWANAYPDNSAFMEELNKGEVMSMDPRLYTKTVAPGTMRLVLKVEAFEHGQTLFSAAYVDRAGKILQFGDFSLEFSGGVGRDDLPPKSVPSEPNMVLPAGATALSNAYWRRGVSPQLRQWVLHPETRDPLDLYVGDALRESAKQRKVSIVAALGDDLIYESTNKGESVSQFLRSVYGQGYQFVETEGHTVIRPMSSVDNVNRSRLGSILRTADAKGYVPLDDLADYAAAEDIRRPQGDRLANSMLSIVVPGLMESSRVEWPLLILWGTFPPGQRASLSRNATIPWASLTTAQRDRITDQILQSDSNNIRQIRRTREDSFISREPTEILATTTNLQLAVRGQCSISEGIFTPSMTDNPYEGGISNAWGLARAIYDREREPNVQHYDGLPKILPNEFRAGRILSFGIRVQIATDLEWSEQSRFGEFDLRSKPVAIEGLPATFREQLEQAQKQLQQQRSP